MTPNMRPAALALLRRRQKTVRKRPSQLAFCCSILCGLLVALAASPSPADEPAVAPPFKAGVWPFRPLTRPDLPRLNELRDWACNAVDDFIGQKLEAAHIQPSSRADKLTLLRRVT